MSRFAKHVRLGVSWLTCGWRLLRRHPWLLGGMGVCGSALLAALWAIPFLGAPLIALVAPTLLAGFYLAIDRVSNMTRPLPAVLRVPSIKQSPRELFSVFRDERRLVPMVVVSLYSIFVGLVAGVLVWLIAGSAWSAAWTGLGIRRLLSVLAAMTAALVLYFLLAASLVYALPRTFLRNKPLIPEIARSIKAGLHYLTALATVLGVLLLPLLGGVVASLVSMWLAYSVAFVAGAAALPLVTCALYCSYRAIYQPRPPVAAHA